MKKWGNIIKNMTLLSQFSLSFITPLLLCLLICWWTVSYTHLFFGAVVKSAIRNAKEVGVVSQQPYAMGYQTIWTALLTTAPKKSVEIKEATHTAFRLVFRVFDHPSKSTYPCF